MIEQQGGAAPQIVEPAPLERYATFTVAGRTLLVALGQLAGVVAPTALQPLPHSSDWILGVAAWRGRAVTVVDLALLADDGVAPAAERKWLLLQWREQIVAVAVSAVGAIVTASESAVQPPLDRPDNWVLLCHPGQLHCEGRDYRCLSVEALYDQFARSSSFVTADTQR